MIARPEAFPDPVAEVDDEILRELADAVFVVRDTADVAALQALDLQTAHAASPSDLLGLVAGARCVVLVDSVAPDTRQHVADVAPQAVVRDVPLPAGMRSVTAMLGYDASGCRTWSLDEAERARGVWIDWCFAAGRVSVDATAEPTSTFPVAALPPVLRAMVTAGAQAQGVDVGYWAVPLLGILAGCVGATRRVRIKADWCEPAVVWSAIVAPSGAGKSPPLRELLRPLREHDGRLHEQTVARLKQHATDVENWKAADTDDRGPKPEPPPMLGAIVSDTTLEALAVRLQDNPRGLLLAVDELAGWLKGFDRYRSAGGDEQAWLAIYNADPLKVDRKGSGGATARVYVKHAAVSVVGTIQPTIARRYLGATEQRASGTCARVLLAQPPVVAARLTDRAIPDAVRSDYGRVLRSLLDLTLNEGGEPIDLPLTAEARERFRVWHDRNGDTCADAGRAGDEDMAAALSKLRGAAPRLALLVALARAAEYGTAALLRTANDEDMAAGIAMVDYFETEARRIYSTWNTAAAVEQAERERGGLADLAERLAGVLRTGPKDREALRQATNRNVPAPRITAALALLQGAGRAVVERVAAGVGRPREVWSLTPDGVSA